MKYIMSTAVKGIVLMCDCATFTALRGFISVFLILFFLSGNVFIQTSNKCCEMPCRVLENLPSGLYL